MIPLVIYICLIAELTLTMGRTGLVRFFLNAGWRYPAEISFLFLLGIVRNVTSLLSLCCFQRACPLSRYTKGVFKAMVRGPGNKCRCISQRGADGAHAKQHSGVRWVTSVTGDAWWQNPGGERSCGSCQGEIQVRLSRKHTHTSVLFVEDGCQRAFGLGPLLFWDGTFFHW